jgi:hypothetical protein
MSLISAGSISLDSTFKERVNVKKTPVVYQQRGVAGWCDGQSAVPSHIPGTRVHDHIKSNQLELSNFKER